MNTTTKKNDAIEALKLMIQPGDRLTIQVQSTTEKNRRTAVFFADARGSIRDLTPATARALGKTTRTANGRETFLVERDGRNAADTVARALGKALFSDENAIKGDLL